jgi:hypothetical protein
VSSIVHAPGGEAIGDDAGASGAPMLQPVRSAETRIASQCGRFLVIGLPYW